MSKIEETEEFITEHGTDVEPALRKAVSGALATAIAAIGAAVGMEINNVTMPWINVIIAFLGPILTGLLIRKAVISPNTAKLLLKGGKGGPDISSS